MLNRRPKLFGSSVLVLALVGAVTGCSGDDKGANKPGASGGSGGSSTTLPMMSAGSPSTTASIPVPDGGIEAPTATTDLTLADAPDLGTVKYMPNRSSVVLCLPGFEGARDYRVFAVEDGVRVVLKGTAEHVDGATLTCAGLRQRNQCDDGAIMPIKYNNEDLDNPA